MQQDGAMIIDELKKVLSVPKDPIEFGKGESWSRITKYFGKPLPGDYMSFVESYGTGEIGSWLTVFNPFSKNPNISLIERFHSILSGFTLLKEEHPDYYSFPLYFEPGGVLPWGISVDGDVFSWLTNGVSGKWSVFVIGRHTEPEKYEMPMCKFIAQSIEGTIKPSAIPQEWLNETVQFVQ